MPAARNFEMQRLHGMGEALYDGVVGPACPVRVYAPVGTHEDLLAYLVRRLLENGANTSFVHRLVDPAVPEDAIIADPADAPAFASVRRAIRAFRCRAICIRTAINQRRHRPGRSRRAPRRCWMRVRHFAAAANAGAARNPQPGRPAHRRRARQRR